MITIGQPPIPLSTASRMSTSSAKTVNYNEAGSSGDMRWRKGIVGGGHAEWRKGRAGGNQGEGKGEGGERERWWRCARGKGEGKGRKRSGCTTTGEIQRATLVGARVCPCIHPCTPGGGDRKVLISPPSLPPSLLRRHPPAPSALCPGRLRPVAAPATFPRRHTVVGAATSPVSVSFSLVPPPSLDHPNFARTTGGSNATDQGRV